MQTSEGRLELSYVVFLYIIVNTTGILYRVYLCPGSRAAVASIRSILSAVSRRQREKFFLSELISTETTSIFSFDLVILSQMNIQPGACVAARGSYAKPRADPADTPQAQKQQTSPFFGWTRSP